MNREWWCSISLWSTRIIAALSSKFRAPASFSPGFSFCKMLGPKTVARFDTVILFPGIYKEAQKEPVDCGCSGMGCPRIFLSTPGQEHKGEVRARCWSGSSLVLSELVTGPAQRDFRCWSTHSSHSHLTFPPFPTTMILGFHEGFVFSQSLHAGLQQLCSVPTTAA